MSAFLGMRGNGDWITNQRPENWRQAVLYLYPNGMAPLTAILSMMGSEATDDPAFHWWTKELPDQGGTVSAVYTNALLTTAATAAVSYAAGRTLYFKVAEAVADEFREGHTALVQKDSNYKYSYYGKVTDVAKNGPASSIAVRLLEATNASYPIASTNIIDVAGSAHAEGATMPDAIAYNPVEYYNYTQIFRTSLSITRTARKTRLRTGDAYQEAKREALELHSIEMEKSFIFGVRSSGTGVNGKPERTTGGIRKWILDNGGIVSDYATYPGNGSVAWTTGGEDWFNDRLEEVFRYGSQEKLALVGNLALLGIQRLAMSSAQMNITPMTTSYGLRVMEWLTPFGTIYLKTHPLFSHRPAFRRDMMILEPSRIKYRYVDDTFFKGDPQNTTRNNSRDGTEEEFLTEAGLEFHQPKTMGYLTGLGLDGTTST